MASVLESFAKIRIRIKPGELQLSMTDKKCES